MPNQYAIIAGKRYNASLVYNTKIKSRDMGEDTIPVEYAQHLWQLAKDSGPFTEIEEDTINYLLERFKWTAAAKTWLQESLSREVEIIRSYYKVIKGLRYDRKILAEVERLVSAQEDGKISVEHAQQLLPLFKDFGKITIVEERTLEYILENYEWHADAKEWFLESISEINKQSKVESSLLEIMETEYGFEKLSFDYYKTETLQQTLDFENKVHLPDALRKALDSLLNDNDSGTFYNNFSYVDNPKEYLEEGRLVLLPGDISSERTLSSFPAPNKGESIRDHWIFGLELFDLTDDIYWVIVARDGNKDAYNYVGGPNVGDIYHVEEEENYFTITIRACNKLAPAIMVDIQEPSGKFIVSKSDKEGRILMTGQAGNYDIYTADNWKKSAHNFEWHGKGTDQITEVDMDC